MGYFRLVYRLAGLALIQVLAGVAGLVGVIVLSPFRNARYALVTRFINWWGRLCCWVMSIRIQQEGMVETDRRGALIVSNHIGTADIFVMSACFRTFFVSKSDISNWPVIGLLTRLAGTIFIDRTRRIQVSGMVRDIADRLRSGFPVAVFPEGGATPGHRVERFKSPAFEAVVQAGSSVIPVTIRYYDAGEPSVACWPMGISFMANLKRLLMHPRLNVKVWVLPKVTDENDRRVLAEKSRFLISEKYMETKSASVEKP